MNQLLKNISSSKQTEKPKNSEILHMPISKEILIYFFYIFLDMNQLKIQSEDNYLYLNRLQSQVIKVQI